MTHLPSLPDLARRFRRDDRGAALVEFAIGLPLMILIFAIVVEGGRMMWSYQAATAGVRDAARYLGRVASSDSCETAASLAGYTAALEDIVRLNAQANTVFPSSITVDSVVPALKCVAGTYRVSPAPVAQVTATLTITFPFQGIFALAGGTLGTVQATVTDESRIFGS
ncbi:pilus assembly protein [Roseivivax marinus]|uniref:TadE/TadG family type IV pilus assembly protein n=1 Tax=Roseivivax marinus TaxID=1379903 RepID=UPI001F03F19C|nr:TadE/TadG family type IV pilus assembly protein [Roseivivax marinus]UMA65802.1 pilus assembly protein [Roseivivax marinus]